MFLEAFLNPLDVFLRGNYLLIDRRHHHLTLGFCQGSLKRFHLFRVFGLKRCNGCLDLKTLADVAARNCSGGKLVTRLVESSRVLVEQTDDVAAEVHFSDGGAHSQDNLQPTIGDLQCAPSLAHHGMTY